MNFTVSSTLLFSHLQSVSRVINSKNALPILDCFLFELNGTMLSVSASDSETSLVTSIEVNTSDADGRFACGFSRPAVDQKGPELFTELVAAHPHGEEGVVELDIAVLGGDVEISHPVIVILRQYGAADVIVHHALCRAEGIVQRGVVAFGGEARKILSLILLCGAEVIRQEGLHLFLVEVGARLHDYVS